jgi:hypothetical protein
VSYKGFRFRPSLISKERRPETWKAELKRKLNQKLAPVTDLLDHVARVSTKA